MKRTLHIFLFFLLLLAPAENIFAQSNKEKIVMPEYPGGEVALRQFLLRELVYPLEAAHSNEVGEVVVGFRVGKDGYISAVRVVESVSPSLDAEAVRVVKLMKYWKPATRNGIPAIADMTIPINFRVVREYNKFVDEDDNGAKEIKL